MCDVLSAIHFPITSSNVFNNVPDLSCSVHNFKKYDIPNFIAELKEIFLEHKVYDQFGVAMVHRHFELEQDEILVETYDDELKRSVAMGWNVKNKAKPMPVNQELFDEYNLKPKKYIFPQTWTFDKATGKLLPFEYLSTNKPLNDPPEEFVTEFNSAVKAAGFEKYIGLRRLLLAGKVSSFESTPNGVEANVTIFGEPPKDLKLENMVKVLWHFNAAGELKNSALCFLHSGSYCDHCGTCGA